MFRYRTHGFKSCGRMYIVNAELWLSCRVVNFATGREIFDETAAPRIARVIDVRIFDLIERRIGIIISDFSVG